MPTTDILTDSLSKFTSGWGGFNLMTFLGWVLFIIIAVGGGFWVYFYYRNKKIFNKSVTAFEIVGGNN